jgi:transmembrane sensor
MIWPFVSRRERVRRQAAGWFAKLRGPEAQGARPAFDRWYGQSSEHAEAYDRIAAHYDAAGLLRQSELGRARQLRDAAHPQGRARRYAFAALVAGAAAMIVYLAVARPGLPGARAPLEVATVSASSREPRTLILADGSKVLLAWDSVVEVRLDRNQRRLRLVRGEGRFSVAHEGRPFIVTAGSAEVLAHGTEFVVRLGAEGTTVSLIEGSVAVSYPAAGAGAGLRRTARLRPGERLTVAPPVEQAPREVPGHAARAAPAMLEFDDTPLSDAVARANGQGGPKVRLADPALGILRVTGGFRAGDNRSLAAGLAAAFGLRVEDSGDTVVLVKAAGEGPQPR